MINKNLIGWMDSIKYLGVYLDKQLTFKNHTNKLSVKCENIFRTLYCFLNRKSKLNYKIKLLLYKALILTYLSGATTALRSWPALGVSEAAHGLAP